MDADDYIDIDLKGLALWNLERVSDHLANAYDAPFLLIDAVRASYLALQAALIHALSGTAGIGALYDKDAAAMLTWFETREGRLPKNYDRVMDMRSLIKHVSATGADARLQSPITMTDGDFRLLDRLSDLRDAFEHPKDEEHSYQVAYLVQPLRPAARLTGDCLRHEERAHRLKRSERERLRVLEGKIDREVVAILTGAWAPAEF